MNHTPADPFSVIREWPTLPERLKRCLPILICPSCRVSLRPVERGLHCDHCGRAVPIRNSKVYIDDPAPDELADDRSKARLKVLLGARGYEAAVALLSPVYPFGPRRHLGKRLSRDILTRGVVVDVGSGNRRLFENFIMLDCCEYAAADIICDVSNLPFERDSVDGFVSIGALEHFHGLFGCIEQMKEQTKPNGFGFHLTPFMFPFHSSQGDYFRFTAMGMEQLFAGWKVVEQRMTAGPVSLILLVVVDVLAAIIGTVSARLRLPASLAIGAVLSPLKIFDFVFVHFFPSMLTCAATMTTLIEKPAARGEPAVDGGGSPLARIASE